MMSLWFLFIFLFYFGDVENVGMLSRGEESLSVAHV